MNDVFAPTLSTSAIWKDAHVLGFGAAGVWDTEMAAHEAELDTMLGLARGTSGARRLAPGEESAAPGLPESGQGER